MKRIPLPSLTLGLAIIVGFFLLFPPEIVGLVVVLLAMVAYQVVLVRRHLAPIPPRGDLKGAKTPENPAPRPESFTARSREADQSDQSAQETPSAVHDPKQPEPGAAISGELFSRFREHLEAAESPGAKPGLRPASSRPAAATQGSELPPAPDATGGEEEVQVRLSPAARRKSKQEQKPPPSAPGKTEKATPAAKSAVAGKKSTKQETPKEDGGDMFSDLTPAQPPKKKTGLHPRKGQAGKPGPTAAGDKTKRAAGKVPRAGTSTPRPDPTGESRTDEVQAALSQANSRADGTGGQEGEDGAVLLRLVEDALAKGDLAGAQAGLEQVLALHSERPLNMPWRVRLAQARLKARQQDEPGAVEAFEALLVLRPPVEERELAALAGEVALPTGAPAAHGLHANLLQKVLGVYRQAVDHGAMDRLYGMIEAALEDAGDEEKLMQNLKNHLEIKKAMDDLDGQLDVIDRIGNRYYKLGDTAAAQQFYEEGLRLREQQTEPSTGKSPS